MNWKTKAQIQRAVAALPSSLSYRAYSLLQRYTGGLRNVSPVSRLMAGAEMVAMIERAGRNLDGKSVLEVGTGSRVNLPIALWLCGAGPITTVDLNPYLALDLVAEDVDYMASHAEELRSIFGSRGESPAFSERLTRLQAWQGEPARLLEALQITYLAPADATRLALPAQSVDFHLSYTVMEHIPEALLGAILQEGKRLLRPGGLFVHLVDLSDHFSHSDPTISAVNFLQFGEKEWHRYAGNRYMYHNRLRADDYQTLFAGAGLRLLEANAVTDARALSLLRSGFALDARFRNRAPEINAVRRLDLAAELDGSDRMARDAGAASPAFGAQNAQKP